MNVDNYIYDDTNYAEQFNTLLVIDAAFANNKHARPEFHILGGTALVFHGLQFEMTIDIDTANRINENVKNIVGELINDNASEVATLAKNYTTRLIAFHPEVYTNIDVYILSIEDLVITKLGGWRIKDQDDLRKSKLMEACNLDKLYTIMHEELDGETYGKLLQRLATVV